MSALMMEEAVAAVTLSEAAANEIKGLFKEQGMENAALRIFVSGGGCSGLQYGMAIAEEVEEGDTEYELRGVRILVDPQSFTSIQRADMDSA